MRAAADFQSDAIERHFAAFKENFTSEFRLNTDASNRRIG
jgi:hypothetical protein